MRPTERSIWDTFEQYQSLDIVAHSFDFRVAAKPLLHSFYPQ